MILFIQILIAHFLGDFIFQTNAFVRDKNLKKIKSPGLYIHVLIHGVLAWACVWQLNFWKYAIAIMLSHLVIDLGKIYYQKYKYQREAFLVDQILHIAVLALVAIFYQDLTLTPVSTWLSGQHFLFLLLFIFLTRPSSVFIKIFISKWTPEETAKIESLQSAGNWIGILERLLVFIFIINQKWDAVGFLLAAKSIFRFGDLKEANDRKLTEYILIGTLASFGLAIAVALLYQYLLPFVV